MSEHVGFVGTKWITNLMMVRLYCSCDFGARSELIPNIDNLSFLAAAFTHAYIHTYIYTYYVKDFEDRQKKTRMSPMSLSEAAKRYLKSTGITGQDLSLYAWWLCLRIPHLQLINYFLIFVVRFDFPQTKPIWVFWICSVFTVYIRLQYINFGCLMAHQQCLRCFYALTTEQIGSFLQPAAIEANSAEQ